MRWMLILVAVAGVAVGDTATHNTTKQRLDGRVLGTVTRDGKAAILFKADGRIRQLPAAEWSVARTAKPAAAPSTTWRWPKVTYKGKPRSPSWLDTQYKHFKDKLAFVDGQIVGLGRIYTSPSALNLGTCAKVRLRILQVIDDDEFLLSYRGVRYSTSQLLTRGITMTPGRLRVIHVRGVPTAGLVDNQSWKGTVACTGTHRYVTTSRSTSTILSCRVLAQRPPPISKAQFVQIVEAGHELVRWKTVRIPKNRRGHHDPAVRHTRHPVP